MARSLAAQNFTMPAMSPTMTEGNIAKWNVKEGAWLRGTQVMVTRDWYCGSLPDQLHGYR